MTLVDYLTQLLMTVFVIFGMYQFYFWCQRQTLRPSICFDSRLDEALPFWPSWTWVYCSLYYPAIFYLNWVVKSPRHFNHMAMSFFLLLLFHMFFFLLIPVQTPGHWRLLAQGPGWSRRLLRLVQTYDAPGNCFPSMHVSVAMLTALHARIHLGPAVYAFPTLVALSCLFTKQHYLIDLVVGAFLGWGGFQIFIWMGGSGTF
jgi:hypothetical protein